MADLSLIDITHLARLARLELTPEEGERYATQLSSVVEYIDQLSEVTGSDHEPVGVSGLRTVLAADELRSDDDLCAIDPLAIVNAAPAHSGRFFQVRAVMADDEGGA